MRVLLVPSLALEGWKAMDRYADALYRFLPRVLRPDCSVALLPDPAYPTWARFAARWVAYPRLVEWGRWDVVHVLDHSYAHVLRRRRGQARAVLTIHDLLACERLACKSGLRGTALRCINGWVLGGIEAADVCLCDSRATLAAVRQHFPNVSERARWQALGVEKRFFVSDLAAARRRGRGVLRVADGDELILHVGSCAPRKNIPALLKAVAALASLRPALRLAQVGGCFSQADRALVRKLGITRRVIQHPGVPEDAMPNVYAAADIVAVPSLFEGFGFPVLEAFAVGVPVVATRVTSLADFPEELLISAGNGSPGEVAHGLSVALDDRQRAVRRACEAREWARAQTWERVARGVAEAYGLAS